MSLYHMMHGVNPATFLILPMLDKHPDEYPRFRDCFIEVPSSQLEGIIIYTRTGGPNRESHKAENEALKALPGFLATWDDLEDSTYAYWAYSVPEQWKADYELITKHTPSKVSKAYQDQLYKIYPKLADKWQKLFGGE